MSDTRHSYLNSIDGLKTEMMRLYDKVEQLELESEDLRASRRQAEEKAWAAEEAVKKLNLEIERKKQELQDALTELKSTQAKLTEAQKRAADIEASRDGALAELRRERDELKKEMDEITSKLDRVSELYREASAEKAKLQEKVDVSDLLGIYIILIEKIFGGKPHARVLYTLHNTKTAITRKNLEASTGIIPTAILKAIHDLRNADLISFDEETQEVKLIKDIL
ncbi:MAG: hypothetical protein HXY34_09080 [Candidatus Thorarchaeota archaeon]|nr:hypothetical protein [Candidatus Thorarchaeota archaeon]